MCISPDSNIFLCCALKSLNNISLSDEVWYHFTDEETETLKLRTLPVIIVKFELGSFWLSMFEPGNDN